MSDALKTWIQDESRALGFDDIGFMNPAGVDFSKDLARFLALNYHGEMSWFEKRESWRASPTQLWRNVKTVIVLAQSYEGPGELAPRDCGEISAYARGRDYHDVVKKKLKALGRAIVAKTGGEIKVFVDTAPVMEKPIAALSGIGWQGKHGNLLSRKLGNWFFLGEIYLDQALEADAPEASHCGSCRACLEACPTHAFDAEGHLDARRCISYLTIEYAGAIPMEFREAIGNRIYGCDICLQVCPWNKFEAADYEPKLAPRAENVAPPLAELLALDDAAFRARLSGSAIKRIGRDRFIRNCLIAAGNSGEAALLPSIEPHLKAENEVVREAANWAWERLNG